ncbi:hypothetical protein [Pyxidicoccus xibeiensis]|uniref:hypothetical protein n=1 Tax=Pyxidicoccus xibeiensis TaxID=2906759 RepID=UPI0020A7DF50|nr:hypothetical protein [Pyxidicoccus xibeiensis]MCP3137643.1 hypothetical protein [Pyxidicoccus xibeiensis]
MTRRYLLAIAVAVGLAGCGSERENDNEGDKTTFQNAQISRNPDSTYTLKAGGQTHGNISSFKVDDAQPSPDVSAFMEAPIEAGGDLCCNSCSLSGGVLICTGCKAC